MAAPRKENSVTKSLREINSLRPILETAGFRISNMKVTLGNPPVSSVSLERVGRLDEEQLMFLQKSGTLTHVQLGSRHFFFFFFFFFFFSKIFLSCSRVLFLSLPLSLFHIALDGPLSRSTLPFPILQQYPRDSCESPFKSC
jgi:hypothetical protein